MRKSAALVLGLCLLDDVGEGAARGLFGQLWGGCELPTWFFGGVRRHFRAFFCGNCGFIIFFVPTLDTGRSLC